MKEIKKNFGFGCMRLPMKNNKVDYEEFSLMIDKFIENGFNYFDTAHGYLGGLSETAIRECLVKRYPRESFILTNKLTETYFNSKSDILKTFDIQLEACGVSYFDFYLMHAQNKNNFLKFKECQAYETALELKKSGKIKHFGISFHDSSVVLEEILKEYPEIEVVQIQFNYIDYDSKTVQSRLCYEVCKKYNKKVIVMEPVKGGNLINIPSLAEEILSSRNNGSVASYAIRFAASFENVIMTLSGMSDLGQMMDNISYMKEFKPLTEDELQAIEKVVKVINDQDTIACTSCRYCVPECPKNINIPGIISDINNQRVFKNGYFMYGFHTRNNGKASDCIKCGKCEKICPQKLEIREYLEEAKTLFEK